MRNPTYIAQYQYRGKWLDVMASNRDTSQEALKVAIDHWPDKNKRPKLRVVVSKVKEERQREPTIGGKTA